MTKEQLAAALDGVQYGEEDDVLKRFNLSQTDFVVVYGASDDLAEVRGALNDEFGVGTKYGSIAFRLYHNYESGLIDFVENLELSGDFNESTTELIFSALGRDVVEFANVAKANEHHLFQFESDNIQFAPFKVMDEDELYCIGCVFSLEDVKKELGVSNDW